MKLKSWVVKHKEVVALFVVPAVMTLLIVAVVLLPQSFKQPKYDFIYEVCSSYCSPNNFVIRNNRIESVERRLDSRFDNAGALYYYDTSAGSASPITLEQAATYELDGRSVSPDGFELERGGGGGGTLFFYHGSDDYDSWYLTSGGGKSKVDLGTGSNDDVNFVGWVIDGQTE